MIDEECRLLAHRAILGTLTSPLCVGLCQIERCSPWPAPFSPQTPPKIALLCSSGSSIVGRGPPPPERARPPCGFAPSRTGLVPLRAEALQRSPGSRACCFSACAGSTTTQDRLLARDYRVTAVLPSSNQERVGVLVLRFSKFNSPAPPIPLSTLRATPRDVTCKTEGQDGVAVSFLVGLFHSLRHAGLTGRTRRSLIDARIGCLLRYGEPQRICIPSTTSIK